MRVLHLYAEWRWTGPADPVLNLCRFLQRKQDYQVMLGFRKPVRLDTNDMARFARDYGVSYTHELRLNRYFNWSGLCDNLFDVRALPAFVRKNRIDLVHTHLSHDFIMAALLKPFLGNAKLVRTHHRGLPLASALGLGILARKADAWIELSPELARQNRAALGLSDAQVHVISGAVDEQAYAPCAKPEALMRAYGITDQDVVLGLAARIQRKRRFRLLLESLALLKAQGKRFKFLCIGRGASHWEEVRQWVSELHLDDCVIFPGYRREDYRDHLALLDVKVFFHPGFDGSCRALLEAMAMGKPAVVLNTGVLPHLVRHELNGFVCEARADEIAGYLSLLIDRVELRARMGEASRQLVLSEHSLAAQADRMIKLYQSLEGA